MPQKPKKQYALGLRSARGELSQSQLAHKIGVKGKNAGSFISRLERKVFAPRLQTLLNLAKALGVTVEQLLSSPK